MDGTVANVRAEDSSFAVVVSNMIQYYEGYAHNYGSSKSNNRPPKYYRMTLVGPIMLLPLIVCHLCLWSLCVTYDIVVSLSRVVTYHNVCGDLTLLELCPLQLNNLNESTSYFSYLGHKCASERGSKLSII